MADTIDAGTQARHLEERRRKGLALYEAQAELRRRRLAALTEGSGPGPDRRVYSRSDILEDS